MLGALLGLVPQIMGLLGKAIPDADKRMEIERDLTKMLVENQTAIMDAMKSVMVADAQSEGFLTRNARPATVFWCLGMITWVVISPAFGLQVETIKAIRAVPEELWSLAAYGIGAYILAKGGVDIAKAIKK